MTPNEMRAFLRTAVPGASEADIEGGVYWFCHFFPPLCSDLASTYKPDPQHLYPREDGEVRCYHALVRKLT